MEPNITDVANTYVKISTIMDMKDATIKISMDVFVSSKNCK